MAASGAERKKEGRAGRKADMIRLLLALAFLALMGILMFLFKKFPDFFFPGYRLFSRQMMKILSGITSVVPFALWDIVIALISVSALAGLVVMIVRRRPFLSWFSRLLLAAAFLMFFETAVWNLNHYGPRLKDEMGLTVPQYGAEDLEKAFAYFYDRAAEEAVLQDREDGGDLRERDIRELCVAAGGAYTPLESEYSVFSGGSKVRTKYLTVGTLILPYLGISGEFAGFTGEATVPLGADTVNLPFSLCHEAGHRLGIASEEDANFASFLACTASDDGLFRYSGWYTAFVYCYNELYDADSKKLGAVMASRAGKGYDLVLRDCDRASEYYAQYDGPMEEVGEKVNDTALKAFSVAEGTRSYSLVVNELIAWYYLNSER